MKHVQYGHLACVEKLHVKNRRTSKQTKSETKVIDESGGESFSNAKAATCKRPLTPKKKKSACIPKCGPFVGCLCGMFCELHVNRMSNKICVMLMPYLWWQIAPRLFKSE